jgi:hypothetical protein
VYGRVTTNCDADVEEMVWISIELVESCGKESWLSFAHVLMPNIMATVLERWQVEEERRIAEDRQHCIEEDCRLKLERRTAQREADCMAHEVAAQQLSPTLSRTVGTKTSNSSLGGGDVEWNSEESMGTHTRSVSWG